MKYRKLKEIPRSKKWGGREWIYWIDKVGGRCKKERLWEGVGIEVRGEYGVGG